jgi:hypothetical protein
MKTYVLDASALMTFFDDRRRAAQGWDGSPLRGWRMFKLLAQTVSGPSASGRPLGSKMAHRFPGFGNSAPVVCLGQGATP